MDLAALVAPTVLARDRTVPVAQPLEPLFPERALTRGHTVACTGRAGPATALAVAGAAVDAGAWLAVVDLPWLGVEAAGELGVARERLVRVDTGPRPGRWAKTVAAATDGFELILTATPRDDQALRRVRQRVQARGGVLLLVGAPSRPTDVVLCTSPVRWERAAHGHGHLRARRVHVEATGRRVQGTLRADLWLPAPGGGVAAAAPAPAREARPAPAATPALQEAG